jgi:uncharacterized protein (DUF983 family)
VPIQSTSVPSAACVPRSVTTSVLRGLRRRCPNCGVGASFMGYLKLREACPHCGEALGHIRADDFPPYLTILIVGHIVVPLLLLTEQILSPPMAVQMLLWPGLTVALTLAGLPRVKGAVVGLMWALRLRGDERQG